jgi:long-chain fatty acid transport protein
MRRAGAAAVALSILAAPAAARASGFLLYEQSAEAQARGGAVSAGTTEPAAVWLNPAALAYAGAAVSLTGTYLRSSTRFAPADGGPQVRGVPGNNVVPSLFANTPVGAGFAAGIGFYAPYGLAVHWPDGWVGSRNSLQTTLYVAAANAVVAYRIDDRFALSAGASLLRGSVDLVADLERDVGGQGRLAGSAWGVGWNAGLLVRALPGRLQLALNFHSGARLGFRGDADFSPRDRTFAEIFADQRASADVDLPAIVTLGVMARPRPWLELGAELSQVRWSSFDHLTIDFERPSTPDREIQRGSLDPLTARLGAEGWLPWAALALRAGLFYDQSATPAEHLDPFAPDARRLGLAAGAGYLLGRVKVDVAYTYVHFFAAEAHPQGTGNDVPPAGTYRTRLQALSLTLTVR